MRETIITFQIAYYFAKRKIAHKKDHEIFMELMDEFFRGLFEQSQQK